MSRTGKKPIALPPQVTVDVKGSTVTVKGPKGTAAREMPAGIEVAREEGRVVVRPAEGAGAARNMHGLARALVQNMVTGVTEGFARTLEVVGTGYKFSAPDKGAVVIEVGYSHPVRFPLPPGITAELGEKNLSVTVRGIDRGLVGQVAANIRKVRPPEPYKGKGIRYRGEVVRHKAGKAGKAAGAA